MDLVLIDIVTRFVERLEDLKLTLAELTLEGHFVEPGGEVHASATDRVGGLVASDGDLVNTLLSLHFCVRYLQGTTME